MNLPKAEKMLAQKYFLEERRHHEYFVKHHAIGLEVVTIDIIG